LERWLDMPRAVDANGEPRLDVFGFCLKRIADTKRFAVGCRVEFDR
jgi:hypothetical protein